MNYTVLGSSGFIGSHVAAAARQAGHDVWCPDREEALDNRNAGHLIYCIGLTADFRTRPHQTVDAHVTQLQRVLLKARFESVTYLSSTRVYQHAKRNKVDEGSLTGVSPENSEDLYNISKLLGECLVLRENCGRVARLSNVYGKDALSANFLFSVIRDCVQRGSVKLRQSLSSAKDYIDVDSVSQLLLRLGPEGSSQIYNIASGINVTHRDLLTAVTRLTGAQLSVADSAPEYTFPLICNRKIRTEFNFCPGNVTDQLPQLVECVRQHSKMIA